MKRILSVVIVLSMIFAMSATVAAATTTAAAVKVKVNNKAVDFKGYNPYKSVSGIMVPLAEAAKAAGAKVDYVKATNEAKVTFGKTVLIFQAGRNVALINGKSFAMGQEAAGIKGKVYVPVRFLFEKMGGKVDWQAKTNTVIVTIKQPAPTPTPTPTPTTPPTGNTNGPAIPVSPDFKPYVAEVSPIDPDILKELQAYKDDMDGDLMYKKNGIGINFYMTNAECIAKVGVEEILEECKTIKSFMELENNVDYRTINTKFIEQYRYFIMPESGAEWTVRGKNYDEEGYAKLRYDDIKKYKIIEQAEFYTDTSLTYSNKNGLNLTRGRLKFKFLSADPQYFKDYGLPQYELNKWYNSDMEVQLGILFTKDSTVWPHNYYSYLDRFYLTNTKLWK